MAGYVVFGFPAVIAVLGLIATAARFGLGATVQSAGLPALCVVLPLVLWVAYRRYPPDRAAAYVAWVVAAASSIIWLLFSPLFYWTGLMLVVVVLEGLRLLTGRLDANRKRKRLSAPAPLGTARRVQR